MLASRVIEGLHAALPGVRLPVDVLLVDGPSGAGKSSLTDALVRVWPEVQVVRLDDIYHGWSGLQFASEHIVTELLVPRRMGRGGRWQRYDWGRGIRAEWREVDDQRPLIVEGCGVVTAASRAVADAAVWLQADDVVRKRRALARDRGAFEPHWDAWQRQFDAFITREHPLAVADVIIDATE